MTKYVQFFCQICTILCCSICLKVFEVGFGEELFFKKFLPNYLERKLS